MPSEPQKIYIASPEAIILQKMPWFKMGPWIPERQWNDTFGVIRHKAAASTANILIVGREYLILRTWFRRHLLMPDNQTADEGWRVHLIVFDV